MDTEGKDNHFDVPTFTEPVLQPGQEGWWQVWGARAFHIRPGDRVLTLEDGRVTQTDVAEVEDQIVRVRITEPSGAKCTIGYGFPGLILMRWDTHHTLA